MITAVSPSVHLLVQEGQAAPQPIFLGKGSPSHAVHLPGEVPFRGATLTAAVRAHVLDHYPNLALHCLEESMETGSVQ